jgi:hypothetical protein
MNLTHSAWLEHDMNTTTWSWTWLILPDWNMTWIQLHGHELDSSSLTWTLHEYNYMVMNLTHPAWLQHDTITTFSSRTWLVLPDWNITWIQLPCYELDSSCLTRAWHEYNFLIMELIRPAWLEHDMNTTSRSRTWLILPDSSTTCIQLPVHELDWSCLTGALHECNFLVMNLTRPAWLEHDMNTTSWSRTWLILPDWSMTWIQLPVLELDSPCLTGTLHEYNYLVKNLIHPAWLEHCMNTITWSRTWFILPDWSMT